MKRSISAEHKRLAAHESRKADWMNWGPYLAERAWGTVREDYSHDGNAWNYFPHDHARSRTYRWNEDGLAGFCDRNQYLCFSLALWNGNDPYLKERLFGLSGPEGNHGEDVKEHYWYCDNTPTHSYARMRYRYPHASFPYQTLIEENQKRGYLDREYELSDTGIFDQQRFFDVDVEYAKASENDILIRITVHNRSTQDANLTLIPQLWFRNTWSWGYPMGSQGEHQDKPILKLIDNNSIVSSHPMLGEYHLHCKGNPTALFTNNETNEQRIHDKENATPWVKDAFHRYVVNGDTNAINPDNKGTKSGLLYKLNLNALASSTVQLRLCNEPKSKPFVGFKPMFDRRIKEANHFFQHIQSHRASDEINLIQRQALAGMLWSKQLYYYNVRQWLSGDPNHPFERTHERNKHWDHLNNFDIMSMPDKWEYPWYAVWDTAFHCLPLCVVDAHYAKRQLLVITREWFMHANGQLPAYEWAYGDVNPPVHAWATYSVYLMDKKQTGKADTLFLERVFQKLLINFTWWVNRKDSDGQSLFEGGFLGLDNISIFDRSEEPPMGGTLKQSDGTAWMGFYAACMLRIALELARYNPAYQDIASKFFEHYLQIAYAINGDNQSKGLWDETDGFYYDRLDLPNGHSETIRVRSLVGLLPMIATVILEDEIYQLFPDFIRRMKKHLVNAPHYADNIADIETSGDHNRHLLAFLTKKKLTSILSYLLDENEFLSPYGIRSLSKAHENTPYSLQTKHGKEYQISYEPGEGQSNLFGGNSNWRGPIWFPINYLIIESLKKYHHFYGDTFTIEFPKNSGKQRTLDYIANELSDRLIKLFVRDKQGKRPWCGTDELLLECSHEGFHQFFEYFNGDTGEGIGASHQTGWTGLIALLIQPELQSL